MIIQVSSSLDNFCYDCYKLNHYAMYHGSTNCHNFITRKYTVFTCSYMYISENDSIVKCHLMFMSLIIIISDENRLRFYHQSSEI